MDVKVDTQRIRDTYNNIKNNISRLESTYNELFDRLLKVPTVTKEWVGSSSENFFQTIRKEKKEYDYYIDDLKKYSKFLADIADDYDSLANNMRR